MYLRGQRPLTGLCQLLLLVLRRTLLQTLLTSDLPSEGEAARVCQTAEDLVAEAPAIAAIRAIMTSPSSSVSCQHQN